MYFLSLCLISIAPASFKTASTEFISFKLASIAITNLSFVALRSITLGALPGRIFSEVKKALLVGPVLFIAPRKGYGNALLCAHCRNVVMCDCGGRLSVTAKLKAPSCVHCGKMFQGWNNALFAIGGANYLYIADHHVRVG